MQLRKQIQQMMYLEIINAVVHSSFLKYLQLFLWLPYLKQGANESESGVQRGRSSSRVV
jgi:hypothetical protein